MTRKILVSIIAIVLVVGVIGGCFALYYTKGADKSITITSSYSELSLVINNGENTAAQSAITLGGFNPDDTTKTIDITLTVDNAALVDGIQGNFKVSLTGDLAAYIDTSVGTLASIGAENVSADITADATSAAGKNIALSTTPVYVRLTFTLDTSADGFNFATIAESTAALTISWTYVEGSFWTYDADTYYLVGTINGENKWQVNSTNENVALTYVNGTDGNNVAKVLGVSLTEGDSIKVVWNYKNEGGETAQWYGNGDGSNVYIASTGTYNIFLYNDNGYKVSAALVNP